jgi:hypothetical protein
MQLFQRRLHALPMNTSGLLFTQQPLLSAEQHTGLFTGSLVMDLNPY